MNNDTMQPNGWFHFHKGHYLEDNVSKSLNGLQMMDIQKSNVKMKMQWTISIQMLGYFYMVHATCLLWLYIKNLDMKCMK